MDLVRVEGLEPPCLTAPDPKSGMSTNFTTPANNSISQLFHSALRRPDRKRRDMSTNFTTPANNSINQLFHSALRRPDRKRRDMSTNFTTPANNSINQLFIVLCGVPTVSVGICLPISPHPLIIQLTNFSMVFRSPQPQGGQECNYLSH